MSSKAQQIALDNALVAQENQHVIGKISGQEFDEPPTEDEARSFIHELGHSGEIKYIIDVIVDHLHQPWRTFASIINKCLCGKEDLAYQIDNKDSKKQDKMFYPRSTKTYYVIALGTEPPKSKKPKMKSDSTISSEETPSKKKPAKAKKDVPYKKKPTSKPKPTKKKAPVKADRGKGLNVLLKVALSKAAQPNEATKRSKKDFHIS
ncbi:hypothetical protein Tco_1375182 [Tanacetum coccineum]